MFFRFPDHARIGVGDTPGFENYSTDEIERIIYATVIAPYGNLDDEEYEEGLNFWKNTHGLSRYRLIDTFERTMFQHITAQDTSKKNDC